MKENTDKHLDKLSRHIIGKSAIEHPSIDFTKNVMSQIHAISQSKLTVYRPLISKSMWFCIALLGIAGICYVVFSPQSESLWFQKLSLDDYISLPNVVPDFKVSQTTFYVVVLFAVMFGIQLPLLKRQLEKRFD